LWIRVTDGGGNTFFAHTIVTPPPTDETQTTGVMNVEGEGSTLQTQLIIGLIVLALILIGMVLRIARIRYTEYEDEEEEEEEAIQTPPHTTSIPTEQQLVSVESFESLPPGGNYDYSTGVTIYIDSNGNNWQMQENGSFTRL